MMYQLAKSSQWFVDGTFSISPSGYIQLLIIVVYIPTFKIFYQACYILLTGKSEKIYLSAFQSLKSVVQEEELTLRPDIVMMDFELGLKNA